MCGHVVTRERVGGRVGSHGRHVSVGFCVSGSGCDSRGRDEVRGLLRRRDWDRRLLGGLTHRNLVHCSDFGSHLEEVVSSLRESPARPGYLLLHDVVARVEVLLPALTGHLASQEVFVGEQSVRILGFEFCFRLDRSPLPNELGLWYKLALDRHLNSTGMVL